MKTSKLLKTIVSMLLALIMAFVPIAQVGYVEADAATVTVKFHYNRDDGNYTGWSVWGWPDGGEGKQLDFSSSDGYGKVASTTTSAAKFGFIVKKGNWEAKDVGEDRFVTIPTGTTGTVHVYLVSGQSDFGTYVTDGATPKEPISATIAGTNKIEVIFTDTPSDVNKTSAVLTDVTNNNSKVVISDISSKGSKATITTSADLDLSHTYRFKKTSSATKYADAKVDFSGTFFENTYTYKGNDLGSNYTKTATTFKVWAPTASEVSVKLYETGTSAKVIGTHKMTGGKAADKGVWSVTVNKDLQNIYYLYEVKVAGKTNLAMDPYAKAGCTITDNPSSTTMSGQRGMVVDLNSTDPKSWSTDKTYNLDNPTDAIIYETSVRDFSIDASSGVSKANRGKYLAFTEKGTTLNNKGKVSTGIDYISKLGVTHVQLMPTYDFAGTNEVTMANYNWGYNPANYNIPEGTFSKDPSDGKLRIKEYKQMVQSIHNAGAGVVMDVVYNHVNNASTFSYQKIVPGYFFRGSNGSGCGNDVASERTMVRKFIVDSVSYWAEEYHLDGFRFDLVGLLDVDTMNAVRAAVNKINPDALIYGEGWTLGTSTTKNVDLATQPNTSKMPGVGMFNDVIRDATGGNNDPNKGYASGNATYNLEGLKYALKGNTSFTNNPTQLINYVSCHDNYTLWDKISKSNSGVNEATRIKMNKLASAIIMTSQGIPFFLSGEEFLRTKNGDHNSYKSSDTVNKMDWNRASKYSDVVNYYKGLIKLRKAYPEFRLTTEQVTEKPGCKVTYLSTSSNILAYTIKSSSKYYSSILVAFNPNSSAKSLKLPSGDWKIIANGSKAGTGEIGKASGKLSMDSYSAYVLIKGKTYDEINKKSIAKAKVTGISSSRTYTGKAIKFTNIKVKLGSKTLKVGRDYTVSYRNNKSIGTATVTITGKGSYRGTIKKTFKIIPKKTNITSVKPGSKKATIRWKKEKNANGYQIYMATSKNGKYKKIKTVTKNSTIRYTKTKLKKNRKYYFKIRTYKKVRGKIYYSTFSTVKSVKVK